MLVLVLLVVVIVLLLLLLLIVVGCWLLFLFLNKTILAVSRPHDAFNVRLRI